MEDAPRTAPAIPVPAVPRLEDRPPPGSNRAEPPAPSGPPSIEVRIDRIELAPPPPPEPPPVAPPPPRGFGEHAAARRFVDRGWV